MFSGVRSDSMAVSHVWLGRLFLAVDSSQTRACGSQQQLYVHGDSLLFISGTVRDVTGTSQAVLHYHVGDSETLWQCPTSCIRYMRRIKESSGSYEELTSQMRQSEHTSTLWWPTFYFYRPIKSNPLDEYRILDSQLALSTIQTDTIW